MRSRAHRSRGTRSVPRVAKLVSFLGCALSVHATPAAAQVPAAVPPSRGGLSAAPPWSAVGEGSPLPSTRARVTPPPVRHPAVHPFRVPAVHRQRLFPRAQDIQKQKRARQEAMSRHPAGKGALTRPAGAAPSASTGRTAERQVLLEAARQTTQPGFPPEARPTCGARRTVRSGDSLWSIAGSIEEGASVAEIAELMQQIFEINRGTIGPDPDVIHPGQSLSLPEDCRR